ncbi:MAG TPA: Trm112 family protein [bacterium]|jgi:uncharacterized protein YbaR (Trm112 family)
MKYRLVEFLQCPDHPEYMLQVRNAELSDVFPCSNSLGSPACRKGCGMYGNWLSEISPYLPVEYLPNCRRCMRVEIEKGELVCPECGWEIRIRDGVLKATADVTGHTKGNALNSSEGKAIERILDLHQGETALSFIDLPQRTLETWAASKIERVQVENNQEKLAQDRAASCADSNSLVHYLEGPFNPAIFRAGLFDALVAKVKCESISNSDEAYMRIPELTRMSGRILLIFDCDKASKPVKEESVEEYRGMLPAGFSGLEMSLHRSRSMTMLLLTNPDPYAGSGIAGPASLPGAE